MRLLPRDPRWLQIAFLGTFACTGIAAGVVPLWQGPLTVTAALGTHALIERLRRLPSSGLLSPAITGLGLTLLLRSDLVWLPPLAAAVAIASKSLLRFGGRHVFNPANLGLCAAMLCTHHAWASPSQWGESTAMLFFFAALGLMVVVRALRSDVSLAFLLFWVALKASRVLWLGQRAAVLEHQLAIGSLVVFAFFMISDPKTTPATRGGRVLFAGCVAGLAFVLQHHFWVMNAPVWALLTLAPTVPLIDRLFKGQPYQWPALPSLQPAGVP
jgi:Na+-transporting NADH:ubiquinone oxidoreductase subunit NqrB